MSAITLPVIKADALSGLAGRKFRKAKFLAEQLGICPRTIFRWANAGKITRHKINPRLVLFDETEVLSFVESSRITGCLPCDLAGLHFKN